MSLFPTDPKKIRAQITRYERELRREYDAHRFISDDYGKRYLLGPLYLLLGDLAGAVKSYAWFERMFPDDMGAPEHFLCWALALYRAGDKAGAAQKLLRAMLSNLYLLPRLFGVKQSHLDIWYSTNLEDEGYLKTIEPVLWELWDAEALQWARMQYESATFKRVRQRYIEIYKQLQTEPVGARRSQLVAEGFALWKTNVS
jgi:tetratricopeptide (TPR) repeat protein